MNGIDRKSESWTVLKWWSLRLQKYFLKCRWNPISIEIEWKVNNWWRKWILHCKISLNSHFQTDLKSFIYSSYCPQYINIVKISDSGHFKLFLLIRLSAVWKSVSLLNRLSWTRILVQNSPPDFPDFFEFFIWCNL
mgnify:CR=1 FL=1